MVRRILIMLSLTPVLGVLPDLSGFLLLAQAVRAPSTWHISPAGSDTSGNGSRANPWKTLTKTWSSAASGDTIVCMDGTYTEEPFIALDGKTNVTIKADAGATPHFKLAGGGKEIQGAFVIGTKASGLMLDGLKIERTTWGDGKHVVMIGSSNVTIRRCTIFHTIQTAIEESDDVIKLTGGPYGLSNILIEDCDIYNSGQDAIDGVGDYNITIRRCRIHYCRHAVQIKGGTVNNLIELNECWDIVQSAILLGGTGIDLYQNPAHPKYQIADSVCRRNLIYYSKPPSAPHSGIVLYGAVNCEVHNNTIYGAGIWITTGGTVDPKTRRFNAYHLSKNCRVDNNIVVRVDSGPYMVDITVGNWEGLQMRNNCYWRVGKPPGAEFRVDAPCYLQEKLGPKPVPASPPVEPITYERFRGYKFDVDSILKDPLLTARPAPPDLASRMKLQPNSPCKDAGLFISGALPCVGKRIDVGGVESW